MSKQEMVQAQLAEIERLSRLLPEAKTQGEINELSAKIKACKDILADLLNH